MKSIAVFPASREVKLIEQVEPVITQPDQVKQPSNGSISYSGNSKSSQGNRIKEHAARRAPSVDRESTGLTAEQARGV